ncbi:hypothetical protein V1478_007216 [Vespula squamosa]|uniref:Uncharacterized protein n=1 Tax=Vespula squamosa TaxID=30214 RepID=A0ABD2B2L3_VESSQ
MSKANDAEVHKVGFKVTNGIMVIGDLNKLSKTVLSQKRRGKAKFFGISYELKGGFTPLTTSVCQYSYTDRKSTVVGVSLRETKRKLGFSWDLFGSNTKRPRRIMCTHIIFIFAAPRSSDQRINHPEAKSTLLYPWNPTGESGSLLAADTVDEEDRSSPIDGFTDRATVFSLLSVEAETALIDDIA